MIEMIEGLPEDVVGLEAVGEVSADDYRSVAVPAVDRARSDAKVRLLYVLGERFTGYSGGAMWEDLELGISHPFSWERIAVVTDHDHVRTMVKGMGWLIPGKVKAFPLDARADAEAWVTA
jgi:hypothetical protein